MCNSQDLNSLIGFLYDEDINDLHCGNFGLREDGFIVIIDYSGFFG
jgi:hypothetical protein